MESLIIDEDLDESIIDLDRPPYGTGLRRNPCLNCENAAKDKKSCSTTCLKRKEYLDFIDSGNSFFTPGMIKTVSNFEGKAMNQAKPFQMELPPSCPKHPDQPQRVNHNGRPTGKCLLCYRETGQKISQARQKNKNGDAPLTDPEPEQKIYGLDDFYCERYAERFSYAGCIDNQKQVRRHYATLVASGAKENIARCIDCEQCETVARTVGITLPELNRKMDHRQNMAIPPIEREEQPRETKGEEIPKEPIEVSISYVAANIPTCPRHPERFQKANKHGMFMGKCEICFSEQMRKINHDRAKIKEGQLLVDFSGFEDIYDWLKTSAKDSLRPVQMETLFHLRKAMKVCHETR